ncbi:hypothetical protein DAMA08_021640 [Martiniozyma asiatica (nom. inval.)]|nr:hypothetical protein DAMA08_021640 [Martiniozyma asiatica]
MSFIRKVKNSISDSDKSESVSSQVSPSTTFDFEKKNKSSYLQTKNNFENVRTSDEFEGFVHETEVKRGLKSRHISMIALGGTIGTGLFIGTSTPLRLAGPVNTLISYLFFGVLAYSVTQSLGEMATHTPVTGSFCTFTTRYLSSSIGFSSNWLYWFQWAITYAIEIFSTAQCILFWTDAVPVWGWILIFFVITTLLNFVPVAYYGEIEFWISFVKVIAIIGFIIYALCMDCGAGKSGPVGFRYWRNPGPWGSGAGLVSNPHTDKFLGWVSSLINAAFTYQGVEVTGITAGESANPRKNVPKAINKVIFRISLFYIGSLFFVGLLVPYNDPQLTSSETFISSSPFLIAINNSGTPILPHIFNAVILVTIFSAGNSTVYLGSRVLYSMAGSTAPAFFAKTNRLGVPYYGVIFTAMFGALAFLNVSNEGTTVFNWLLNISALAGIICWCFITATHIRFINILNSRNISRDTLPFKANFGLVGAYTTLFFLVLITFIQGYSVFFDFNVNDFFANYVSLLIWAVFWLGSQLTIYRKEPWLVPMDDVDIDTDAREIDNEVWEEEERNRSKADRFWDALM